MPRILSLKTGRGLGAHFASRPRHPSPRGPFLFEEVLVRTDKTRTQGDRVESGGRAPPSDWVGDEQEDSVSQVSMKVRRKGSLGKWEEDHRGGAFVVWIRASGPPHGWHLGPDHSLLGGAILRSVDDLKASLASSHGVPVAPAPPSCDNPRTSRIHQMSWGRGV